MEQVNQSAAHEIETVCVKLSVCCCAIHVYAGSKITSSMRSGYKHGGWNLQL
jgi:hypothetical protein